MRTIKKGFLDNASTQERASAKVAFEELFQNRIDSQANASGYFSGIQMVEGIYSDYHRLTENYTKLQFLEGLKKVVNLPPLLHLIEKETII